MTAKSKLNWKPITALAIKAAEDLGHKLGEFELHRNRLGTAPQLRMASCEKCYGCCWIAWTPTRGFGAGGRLLAYRCGTNEAMGRLAADEGKAAR